MNRHASCRHVETALVATLVLGAVALSALAQSHDLPSLSSLPDPLRGPLLRPDLVTPAAEPSAAPASPERIRLFRIQPGFLTETPGLEGDEEPHPAAASAEPDGGLDWVNLSVGNDNPFFDFRRRDDPGGVGYTRLNTQIQLFDTPQASLSLGFQAVAPAGLEYDGLADNRGATVLTPAVSWFQSLGEGTALQAFVGKHLPVVNHAAQPVRRGMQYGVAVQRALYSAEADLLGGLYLSLGAVGQVNAEPARSRAANLEVLPGLTWKMADSWWITGGVAVPLGPGGNDAMMPWQVTCQVRY